MENSGVEEKTFGGGGSVYESTAHFHGLSFICKLLVSFLFFQGLIT